MKIKNLIVLVLCVFMVMAIMPITSYAGLTVTKVTSGTSTMASSAFAYCYNLRVSNSTLGENALDPHLMLNSDYAAALYLAISPYGGKKAELSYSAGGVSMNGNASGIYSGYTNGADEVTSAIFEGHSTTAENLETYSDTKYVEVLPSDVESPGNLGRALSEIQGWQSSWTPSYSADDNTILCRGAMTYFGTYPTNYNEKFRPVIWN